MKRGRPPIPLEQRLARFTVAEDCGYVTPCHIWTGWLNNCGYPTMTHAGKTARAHGVVYEHFVGPIPEGLELDHLCRVRACVNPAHLEPVTHWENMLRGDTNVARGRARTHCSRGHLMDEANVYQRPRGNRECRKCNAERKRAA